MSSNEKTTPPTPANPPTPVQVITITVAEFREIIREESERAIAIAVMRANEKPKKAPDSWVNIAEIQRRLTTFTTRAGVSKMRKMSDRKVHKILTLANMRPNAAGRYDWDKLAEFLELE